MARISDLFMEDPTTARSRRLINDLARGGIPNNRDRVQNLMRRME
jgi:putative transposase